MFRPTKIIIVSLVLGAFGFIWLISQCNKSPSWCEGEGAGELAKLKDRLEKVQTQLELRRREIEKKEIILGISQLVDPDNMPTIYALTPTHTRGTQKADLTRLSQTLLHVRKFHWVVIEDAHEKSQLVTNFLKNCGVKYTHLAVRTPEDLIRQKGDPRWLKARGVEQRNLGLRWVRENFDPNSMEGVVYFVDDDNTYDLKLFEQMRYTKKVSVWPVGLVGGLRWEGPICENGKVKNFHTAWRPERSFPIDMAGFAINAKLIIQNRQANFDPDAERGYQEATFLEQLVSRAQLEAMADDCKKVLVWHTQTAVPNMKQELKLRARGGGSDPSIEV